MKMFSKSLFFSGSRSLKSSIVQLLHSRSMALGDLQASTRVSLPTLRRDLHELIRAGWVRRVGRTSTGGRPATLYGLNGDSHLLLGVHLELPALNMVLMGLDGCLLDAQHFAGEDAVPPELTIKKIAEYVQEMCAAHTPRQVLGVGVATPGFIDPETGEIIAIARAPGWHHFPLKARLEAELALPVVVENDIDCMAFAELAQNDVPASADMLFLGVSEGVKATLILRGELYKGPYSNAGIVGRTIISHTDGEHYLEEIMSVGAVCAAFDRALATAPEVPETLRTVAQMDDRGQKFQAILDMAAAEQPLCAGIVSRALHALAIATANLIYLLQPGLLIVGGALSNLPVELRTPFERHLRSHLPALLSNRLLIKYATLTDTHVGATGAAYRFLYHYPVEEADLEAA